MSERDLKNLLDQTAQAWAEKKRGERKAAQEIRNLEAMLLVLKWVAVGSVVLAGVLAGLALASGRGF